MSSLDTRRGRRTLSARLMNRRHFLRATAALALTAFTLAGAACAAGPKTQGREQDEAKRRQLEREIAALEARMRAALPEFESEQHAWEAEVMQQAGAKGREVPARILAILALEPSEREPAQREEVAAYFRPLSKTLGALSRQLAAKRKALAALPPAARAHAGDGGCTAEKCRCRR